MAEMDFEQLVKLSQVATNPQVGANALSIQGILKQLDSIEKIVSSVDKFVKIVETSPTLSTAVKIISKNNGFGEVTALRNEVSAPKEVIVEVEKNPPASDTHRQMFLELNKISEDKLKEMLEAYKNGSVHPEVGNPEDK